mmetsp:Transcript_76016/g.180884  ORF Transcript_76016/g.180884 Transcript_76016/m.180884 type:complete len:449 (+) Transcript_76016:182-1528(+)
MADAAGPDAPEEAVAAATPEAEAADQRLDAACSTNLNAFHAWADMRPQVNGRFTRVRGLAWCINGKAGLYRWVREDQADVPVVVKKMPPSRVRRNATLPPDYACEKNVYMRRLARHPEDSLTEIGVYSRLASQDDLPISVVRMVACYEAPFRDIWPGGDAESDDEDEAGVDVDLYRDVVREDPKIALVMEYATGGEAFAYVDPAQPAANAALPLADFRRFMWQLFHAASYLHRHNIGHRDISLENILMKTLPDGTTVMQLMDFGQACELKRGEEPLRYFWPVGKPMYRPAEAYIPRRDVVDAWVPKGTSPGTSVVQAHTRDGYFCEVLLPPDATAGSYIGARPAGYTVEKLDIFMAGVCFFVLRWRRKPWGMTMRSDKSFEWVLKNGGKLSRLVAAWKLEMLDENAMHMLDQMTHFNPARRPSLADCLASPWFDELQGAEIDVHPRLE